MDRVNRSFEACWHLLGRPRAARRGVVALLTIQTALLAYSAYVHSPTLNEPGHLVAGLTVWRFGRFDVYNVNPPLVKMVAALPVLAAGYEEDWTGLQAGPGARPEFELGEHFVAANGERSLYLIMIARWACLPFIWIGGIVCYLWARDLYGRPAGVIACAIWCFEPNILANASVITPDAHATALGVAACYSFWKWLRRPTLSQAALTGVALGIAELSKATFILYYPLWPLIWVAYRWPTRHETPRASWKHEAGMLCLILALSLNVLNVGYAFDGTFTRLGDFRFFSDLLTHSGPIDKSRSDETVAVSDDGQPSLRANRFANTWMAVVPVPLPREFVLGIDAQQRDFEDFPWPSYLRGQFKKTGWWYYYLYALAIKVPIGLLIALIVLAVCRICGRPPRTKWRDSAALLLPPVAILIAVSSKTGFSHHMRYVLPCFPFLVIWISQCVDAQLQPVIRNGRTIVSGGLSRMRAIGMIGGVAWACTSSVWIYPHSVSYFNETVGGPNGGARHLLNSNIDWGQDLNYLRWWYAEQRQLLAAPLYLAYYGFCDPQYLGFRDARSWPSDDSEGDAAGQSTSSSDGDAGIAKSDNEDMPAGSYFAISINLLHGVPWEARGGRDQPYLVSPEFIELCRQQTPAFRAGYSIVIFRFPDGVPMGNWRWQ